MDAIHGHAKSRHIIKWSVYKERYLCQDDMSVKISPNFAPYNSEQIVSVVNKKRVIDCNSDGDLLSLESGLKCQASGVTLSPSQSVGDTFKGEKSYSSNNVTNISKENCEVNDDSMLNITDSPE
jgi:hypothetical protein